MLGIKSRKHISKNEKLSVFLCFSTVCFLFDEHRWTALPNNFPLFSPLVALVAVQVKGLVQEATWDVKWMCPNALSIKHIEFRMCSVDTLGFLWKATGRACLDSSFDSGRGPGGICWISMSNWLTMAMAYKVATSGSRGPKICPTLERSQASCPQPCLEQVGRVA